MSWKRGNVTLDDGTVYPAELLIRDGEVWNVRIFKEDNVVEEIDAEAFANKLGKKADDVYPFTYELE
ncbi:MAG: hypothetical protein N4A57_14840 [Anaeromicrobium sp.]|jgi:hypothetical protein|uniref:hypothetical protein n=1 Tax=Anaeromicrobium sp. TaxID=1929132 RepID=UPI0025EEDEF6|nr:hypothetical protein [Anaeromicrobium sp.]MCT4595523.1 hypothetical protein [Anaeromicrobium sp.]